jgi:hypothetical protein
MGGSASGKAEVLAGRTTPSCETGAGEDAIEPPSAAHRGDAFASLQALCSERDSLPLAVSGKRPELGRKDTRKVRPATCLLSWIVTLFTGCAFHHPLGAEWEGLPIEGKEARAIEAVRTAIAQRGGRIPGRPGAEENQVLLVDRRLAVYRPCCERPGADVSPGNLAVLLFQDIVGLERRVVYDFPSHPEDLSIYLRRKSPSVWGVGADESLLSPLLSRVGRGGAVLLLPHRPRETYWRLEAALEYLLSLPRPREGVGLAVEGILRQSVEEKRERERFETDVLAALREHLAEPSNGTDGAEK